MPSHGSHSKAAPHNYHHHHHHHPQQRHPLALTLAGEGGNAGSGPRSHGSTNNQSAERIEWSRSTILGFIEDYRRQRVLWDPNTKGYHIKQIKYEALKQLGLKYGTEIRSIRSKIKSLRSSFHREHGKVINGQRRGVHYQPMWFAYEAIHFILDGEQHQQQTQQQHQQQQEHQQQELYDNPHSLAAKRDTSVGEDGEGKGDDHDDHDGNEDEDGNDDNGVGDVEVEVSVDVDVNIDANGVCLAVHSERASSNGDVVDVAKAMKRRRGASDYGDYRVHNNAMITIAAGALSGDDDNNDGTPQQQQQQQQQGVKRADSDAEMQHFGKIISAEDVKTELIESDAATDLHRSPLAYLSLTPTVTSSSSASKKRKRTPPQPDAATLLLCATGGGSHQLRDESQTLAISATTKYLANHSRAAQEAASSTTTAAATAAATATAMAATTANATGAGTSEDSSSHTFNHSNNNNNNSNNNSSNNNNAKNNSISSSFSAAGHVDEYGVFGEYVAITIRKLKTPKAKIVVKHLINNLLYEAELGHYDYGIPASKEPPQLYKT